MILMPNLMNKNKNKQVRIQLYKTIYNCFKNLKQIIEKI